MRVANPDRNRVFWLVLLVALGALGFAAYKLVRHARMGAGYASLKCTLDADIGGYGHAGVDCAATFLEVPPGLDTKDVRLVLKGAALRDGEVEWRWDVLGPRDAASRNMLAPPVKKPLRWRLAIHDLLRKERPALSNAVIEAQLHWGGERQDVSLFNAEFMYRSGPSAEP